MICPEWLLCQERVNEDGIRCYHAVAHYRVISRKTQVRCDDESVSCPLCIEVEVDKNDLP